MIVPELELPVAIGYGEGQEEKIVKGYFNPTEITCYHDGYFSDVGIFIYLKGGQVIQIAMTLVEYQRTLRHYWQTLANQQNVKQKLGVRN